MTQLRPFVVLENGKPCCYRFFPVHPSWNRCQFKVWGAAASYALNWLGHYVPSNFLYELAVGQKYYYNGHDFIVIIDKRIHNIKDFAK